MKKILFICALVLVKIDLSGQDFLRFSGLILEDKGFLPVEGTTILNKSTGSGAVTDTLGFFSIKAFPGDTLEFRDIRYLPSTFVVPEVLNQPDYGFIQLMRSSTVLLDEVAVYSFPSEDEFREAFLAVKVKPGQSDREYQAQRDLMRVLRESYDSEKYYYEMWADRRIYELTGEIQPNHFLDPFRWTEFIRDFRKNIIEGE